MSKNKKTVGELADKADEKMRSLGFSVTEETFSKLRVLAFVTESSVSQVARDLINDNLDKKLAKYKDEVQEFLLSLKIVE